MMRFAFAGDRDISVWVLEYILGQGLKPSALLLSSADKVSHANDLKCLCSHLQPEDIFAGNSFRQENGLSLLKKLDLDYIIAVHFPYLIPNEILSIPKIGVLNLHPAFLPYNRGWHTPSWAILDKTPIGATLHFMKAAIDTGDIVHRKQLKVLAEDTANTLYQRVKDLEIQVFKEAWRSLLKGDFPRLPQDLENGTTHNRQDLFSEHVQKIELDTEVKARYLIDRLRALTTSRLDEAAYFVENGRRYRIQVAIHEVGLDVAPSSTKMRGR